MTPSQPAAAEAPQALKDATVVLNEVGQAIVDNPAYRRVNWSGISLVAELDGQKSLFGYVYAPNGSWEAELPEGFAVLRKIVELRDTMQEHGKAPWKAGLFQLRRTPEIKFHAQFEYDDGDRWKVAPDNLEARVEELRPR